MNPNLGFQENHMKKLSRIISGLTKSLIMLVSFAGLVSGAAVAQNETDTIKRLGEGTVDNRLEISKSPASAALFFANLLQDTEDAKKRCIDDYKLNSVLGGAGLAGLKVAADAGAFASLGIVAAETSAAASFAIPTAVFAIGVGVIKEGGEVFCNRQYDGTISEWKKAQFKVTQCKDDFGVGVVLSAWTFKPMVKFAGTNEGLGIPELTVVCNKPSGLPGPLFTNLSASGPMVIKDGGGTIFAGSSAEAPGKACNTLDQARARKDFDWATLLNPIGRAGIELDMVQKKYLIGWKGVDDRFYTYAKGDFTQKPALSFLLPNDKVTITLKPFRNEFLTGALAFLRTETFAGGDVTLTNFRPNGSGYLGFGTMDVSGIQWNFGQATTYLQTNCLVTLIASGSINGIAK
jgi:hypothetical protein